MILAQVMLHQLRDPAVFPVLLRLLRLLSWQPKNHITIRAPFLELVTYFVRGLLLRTNKENELPLGSLKKCGRASWSACGTPLPMPQRCGPGLHTRASRTPGLRRQRPRLASGPWCQLLGWTSRPPLTLNLPKALYTHAHIPRHTDMYRCIYMYTHTRIHACHEITQIHIHIYIYIYIYVNTHSQLITCMWSCLASGNYFGRTCPHPFLLQGAGWPDRGNLRNHARFRSPKPYKPKPCTLNLEALHSESAKLEAASPTPEKTLSGSMYLVLMYLRALKSLNRRYF